MENIVILAVLIVAMEYAVQGLKKPLETMQVWEKLKGVCIPVINILLTACLILGTNITILAALSIACNQFVDYLVTILICSLGTTTFHEFKKKLKGIEDEEVEEIVIKGFKDGE